MRLHPAAESLDPPSNLWQKSNLHGRNPLRKAMRAGALREMDLEEEEAPSAHLLCVYAEGCGRRCLRLAVLQRKLFRFGGVWCLSSCVGEQRDSIEE